MKFFLFSFIVLIVSCTPQTKWLYQSVHSDYQQFNSCQLTYTPDNKLNGIEVQLLKGTFGILGFLNIFCCELECEEVVLQISDYSFVYKGILMEGKQRLQLPPEATKQLIDTLAQGNRVTILLGNYCSTIPELPVWLRHQKLYKVFAH